MDPVPTVAVPLRAGKKMKKRKELDALVANTVSKRASGVSSHEQLLSDSSDEWAGVGGLVGSARGRRRMVARRRVCSILSKACSILLILTCAIATLTVMWLFIDVRQQVTSLRTELNQVVAAHQGVPDALHACHSLSKELHKNQTEISNKLSDMTVFQRNLTENVTKLQNALSAVQQQLNASPSLLHDPQLVNELSKQVAEFGSKIQDLQTTTSNLKEQDSKHEVVLSTIGSNVTDLHAQVAGLVADRSGVSPAQLADAKAELQTSLSQLVTNVTMLNDTLTSKLKWTAEDQKTDHKTVVSLQEMDQNITARLRTLEDIFSKISTSTSPPQVSYAELSPTATEQQTTQVAAGTAAVPPPAQPVPLVVSNKNNENVPPPLQPVPSGRP